MLIRVRLLALTAIVAGCLAVPQSATALSFTVPAGQKIDDIDLQGVVVQIYDGAAEMLTISARVASMQLSGGSSLNLIALGSEVYLEMGLSLVSVDFVTSTLVFASVQNGATDFSLIDRTTATPEIVFAGDFDVDPTPIQINGFFSVSALLSGQYSTTIEHPDVAAAVRSGGEIVIGMSALSSNGVSPYFQASDVVDPGSLGLKNIYGQVTADFNFLATPEPGSAALLVVGLTGLAWTGSRARRRL